MGRIDSSKKKTLKKKVSSSLILRKSASHGLGDEGPLIRANRGGSEGMLLGKQMGRGSFGRVEETGIMKPFTVESLGGERY